ncbi:hypothetical protein BROUX41_003421 [Berkeleyomyces rouxiae]|uniref:uncharacterized protein n=1 Tax=Berkeleyomyces rouxiae TaxID=2035830 RepID=UPI003B7CE671
MVRFSTLALALGLLRDAQAAPYIANEGVKASGSNTLALHASPTSSAIPPTITVAPTPAAGQYGTVQSAIAALPDDGAPYTIYILGGTYVEQVSVNRTGLVTIRGETDFLNDYTQNKVRIEFSRGSRTGLRRNEDTPVFYSNKTDGSGLSLYNIDFVNTFPQTTDTAALAADFVGTNMAAYGCSFIGFQDTLLANTGKQLFSNSYIEGSVDFIWGFSKAFFHQCYIASNTGKGSCITAQNRRNASMAGGFVFDSCYVTYTSTYGTTMGQTYLGRPWSSYAISVFRNSFLDKHINPAGWKIWSTTTPQTDNVLFGEFQNTGPGAWSSTTQRASFATNMTAEQASAYDIGNWLGDLSWVDKTAYAYVPSYPLKEKATKTESHYIQRREEKTTRKGTTPPAGAFIVSKKPIKDTRTFSTIQDAVNALPANPQATATVFIYPGSYNEQLVLKKNGTTIFLGYSERPEDYSANTVTITFSRGADTQGNGSNSDGATVYATGNYFKAQNINFHNTFGTVKNYAVLGFGVRSSKYASLYQCSVVGTQDALLINGNLFASNSYIEGTVDMIWGSGRGYFLNSTIRPVRDDISITANKRANSTAPGGFVFDQCNVTPPKGANYTEISLGRPWNNLARVAFIKTHLDSCVQPSGWEQWSKTKNQTDGVLFGEYENSGPGSDTSARASFSTQLSESEAAKFELSTFFGSDSWIDESLLTSSLFVADD